jgi:DNA-binding MarR family transcriptional regulator
VIQHRPHDAVEHELAVLFRRARSFSGELAREVHPGLEPAAYALLLRVEEVGAVRLTDLASFYGIGKPTVSRQLGLLQKLGLVQRVEDAHDRRSAKLSMTEDGLARLAKARKARRNRFERLLGGWEPVDITRFGELLGQFNRMQD